MDEAGRGSWAGPVVASAVILPKGKRIAGLNDSKLLTEAMREELYTKIMASCQTGVGFATNTEVDEHGLLHATYLAFKRALENLPVKPTEILIDGRDKFSFSVPHTSIIKGDQKIKAISAASIIAKVVRDRLMKDLALKYPLYGFEEHKGYGTERHQNALKEYGPSQIHRISYAPIKNIICRQETLL